MSEWSAAQQFVFETLVADAVVHDLIADRVYDNVPDPVAWPYVAFGASDLVFEHMECLTSVEEVLYLHAHSSAQGRQSEAKDIGMAIMKALHGASGAIVEGQLVNVVVLNARSEDMPDGVTAQSVVTVRLSYELESD